MKIGDKVRFLSEKGGGRISGFQGKDIVLVEDEDGFDVPMRKNEVVVVGDEPMDGSRPSPVPQKSKKPAPASPTPVKSTQSTPGKPVQQRAGGDKLSVYLAFVPIDVKELSQTRFETYIVNDSNYYVRYTYLTAEGNAWRLRATAEVEPNTKEFVEEFGREVLGELEHVSVQLLAYKRERPFLLKPAVGVQLRLDPVKFYKLHTFQENDFFEQPAIVRTLVENDEPMRPLVLNAAQLKSQLMGSGSGQGAATARPQAAGVTGHARAVQATVSTGSGQPLVVDLHADELLETTAGMSASDILNYQLDVFRRTLKEHQSQRGQKIVFIHGKGEGVLRRALINELQYRFKTFQYQDASFQEYGYGATQVTIK